MVAEKDHSPKILGNIIRSKGSKVEGDGAILLCTGQIIAHHMVFSSWYQLTAKGVLTKTDDVYREPNACETVLQVSRGLNLSASYDIDANSQINMLRDREMIMLKVTQLKLT